MIRGLAITPPVVGRISIGRVVERKGKRLPEKDDQFTVTTQVQAADGWLVHPVDKVLRKENPDAKLRTIPIRLAFNDPDLNFRAQYSLFDRQKGRPLCVGNGETCRRRTEQGIETLPCPAPEGCDLAKEGNCKPYGRLNVLIGDEDAFGTFIFRTTGFNSIRSIYARLNYLKAVSGNRLACMDLELRLRAKTTAMSFNTPVYYVDITTRDGKSIEEAITDARTLDERRRASGLEQDALDDAARKGLGNGAFEDTDEDVDAVVEELFPDRQDRLSQHDQPVVSGSLKSRLADKAQECD